MTGTGREVLPGSEWVNRARPALRVCVVRLLDLEGGAQLVEYRRRRRGRGWVVKDEEAQAFQCNWQPAHEAAPAGHALPPRLAQVASPLEVRTGSHRHPTGADNESFTPRMREVFSRPITPYLLAELARERPDGACIVCWRDIASWTKLNQPLACERRRPGLTTQPCRAFVNRVHAAASAAQKRAKQRGDEKGGEPWTP